MLLFQILHILYLLLFSACFLYLRLLYFSSNSTPSKFSSSVKGCLQCMQASTRPSILVGFSQVGQIIWTAFVDSNPIHKYMAVLNKIAITPKIKNVTINHSVVLKIIPIYIIRKPIKTRLKANVLILFILLEYFSFGSLIK